jgi:hypothetical protein
MLYLSQQYHFEPGRISNYPHNRLPEVTSEKLGWGPAAMGRRSKRGAAPTAPRPRTGTGNSLILIDVTLRGIRASLLRNAADSPRSPKRAQGCFSGHAG